MLYDLPTNPTTEQLEAAYAAGLLRKEQLMHGAYYRGHCRNASIARWHAPAGVFIYRRVKFGHAFLEEICHPVDERRYDVFLPQAQVEPTTDERIDDAAFERVATERITWLAKRGR